MLGCRPSRAAIFLIDTHNWMRFQLIPTLSNYSSHPSSNNFHVPKSHILLLSSPYQLLCACSSFCPISSPQAMSTEMRKVEFGAGPSHCLINVLELVLALEAATKVAPEGRLCRWSSSRLFNDGQGRKEHKVGMVIGKMPKKSWYKGQVCGSHLQMQRGTLVGVQLAGALCTGRMQRAVAC